MFSAVRFNPRCSRFRCTYIRRAVPHRKKRTAAIARHARLAERVIAISGAHSLCAVQWGKAGIGIADHALCPETIAVPLSVIAVEGDTLAPAKTLAELAVRAPNAWLQKIASAHGHAAYLKETTAIAAAINTALDD